MPKTVLLSRPDNLGDSVLTLPLAGFLKGALPHTRLVWLGKAATQPLISCCTHVDSFLPLESVLKTPELLVKAGIETVLHVFPHRGVAWAARKAKIPERIGTSHRWYHWPTCTNRVDFSRKTSDLHEAQLNFHLLAPLKLPGAKTVLQQPADWLASLYGLANLPALPPAVHALLTPDAFTLVLHPKSRGSAREWPLGFYRALLQSLPRPGLQILVTGTAEEGQRIRQEDKDFLRLPGVTDLTGKLSLTELIALLGRVDGLVACSTGPLHIAAALGKHALGIYPPIRPMHPGRWRPLGPKAEVLVDKRPDCKDCKNAKNGRCACIERIGPQQVYERIMHWRGLRNEAKTSVPYAS